MSGRTSSPLFRSFVDDELLRAPMLFDQVLDAVVSGGQRAPGGLQGAAKRNLGDMLQAVQTHRLRLGDYFMRSLREQVLQDMRGRARPEASAHAPARTPARPLALALVDDNEVAVEVELSNTIETIKSTAEYELRELQTYVEALVGDFDMAQDHNPFRPAAFARATWAASQALPLSRGHQILFMRECATPLAQLLRTAYAASSSRLESQGVEPAAFRTLILPSGSRREARTVLTTFNPDLHRISETMPARPEAPPAARPGEPVRQRWAEVAPAHSPRADRQAVELICRLFEQMVEDSRVPKDVLLLISRLHGPAMRLAIRDRGLLDHDSHPMWHFINQLVFMVEMTPDPSDPERQAMLQTAQAAIDQLASETVQHSGLYRWALQCLRDYLGKSMKRRLARLASQVGALQKWAMVSDEGERKPGIAPTTLSGPLDAHQLDTVPAELILHSSATSAGDQAESEAWLAALNTGDWLRMFFSGRWLHAQLLWRSEQGEIMLFGDGASEQTWAVRRSALQLMHRHGLVKTLRIRSIVGSAARRVQLEVAAEVAA